MQELQDIGGYKINVERHARLLAKRWRRDRSFRACDLTSIKNLSGNYPIRTCEASRKIDQAIERRAREIFNSSKAL